MSSRGGGFVVLAGGAVLAAACLLAALPALAQYPGQVTKTSKDTPELRAIAVLEWTGEAGKPKTSRLVPVAVLDGGKLQDGGIYLARPQPLALAGEVEYELEQDGRPIGLFDIKNSGQEQGSWVGYGTWKPMPAARPKPAARELARTEIDDDAQSDQPVLHRKHHADEEPAGGAGSGGSGGGSSGSDSDSGGQAQATDPDRPTLHKKPSSDSTGDAGSSTGTGSASSGATPASTNSSQTSDTSPDPDRPTLHKRASSDSSGSGSGTAASAPDADRPTLKKKKQPEDVGHVDSLPDVTDPDRPRLKRGKSNGGNLDVVPSLMGLPPDMRQAVAVSDARSRPEHPWEFAWANPDDEAAMKSALEGIARDALGLNPPPPKTTPRRTTTQTARKSAHPTPPPPAALEDEQFRVFELAYGAGATMVLTAHTGGPFALQKFVTLIAQPDLYGNVLVLLKNVTDGAHLDDTPRMKLVDAVDAMADNRGELLFELRGQTQRQFALYRVLRGQAEKLFVSGGGEFGSASSE
ncbi:MAG: hypothetical protein ABR924_09505 [Terracidiphilus sp.]